MYETITVKKHNLILTDIHYIGILCSFKEIRCVVLYCAFDFFYLLKEKYPELNIKTDTYLSELRPLQTRYGKEGMIGLANRCIKKEK